MEEQLISFETAKLAKEKDFIEKCLYATYTDPTDRNYKVPQVHLNMSSNSHLSGMISLPTQSLLQKWFRIKHQIFIDILTDQTTEPKFAYKIKQFVGNPHDLTEKEWYWKEPIISQYLYRTYEECLEEAEHEALKLIP